MKRAYPLAYVAGSRHERERVNEIQTALAGVDIDLTFDWTGAEGTVLQSHAGGHEGEDLVFWRDIAERELEAVNDCDFLVAVMSPEGRGRGMFIEMGAALARYKPVYLIGDAKANDSNFYSLDYVYLCKSTEHLLQLIKDHFS